MVFIPEDTGVREAICMVTDMDITGVTTTDTTMDIEQDTLAGATTVPMHTEAEAILMVVLGGATVAGPVFPLAM